MALLPRTASFWLGVFLVLCQRCSSIDSQIQLGDEDASIQLLQQKAEAPDRRKGSQSMNALQRKPRPQRLALVEQNSMHRQLLREFTRTSNAFGLNNMHDLSAFLSSLSASSPCNATDADGLGQAGEWLQEKKAEYDADTGDDADEAEDAEEGEKPASGMDTFGQAFQGCAAKHAMTTLTSKTRGVARIKECVVTTLDMDGPLACFVSFMLDVATGCMFTCGTSMVSSGGQMNSACKACQLRKKEEGYTSVRQCFGDNFGISHKCNNCLKHRLDEMNECRPACDACKEEGPDCKECHACFTKYQQMCFIKSE